MPRSCYDLGILSPRMFAMLVIMALFTTFMTGPLLTLAEFVKARRSASERGAGRHVCAGDRPGRGAPSAVASMRRGW